ncbi:MAG: leucyl aminopeptidase family protein [Proteobacteria bacterium]|nr:leucyl aminopeptidase family protein [Pseudomonadota bacterium]
MAQRTGRAKEKSSNFSLFDLDLRGWLGHAGGTAKGAAKHGASDLGRLVVVGKQSDAAQAFESLHLDVPQWLLERAKKKRGELLYAATDDGPLWLVQLDSKSSAAAHGGLFAVSPYGVARDLVAQIIPSLADHALRELQVHFVAATEHEQLGALVGLELGGYRYRQIRQPRANQALPRLRLEGVSETTLEEARLLGVSTNMARHLVNLPAAELNPKTYADAIVEMFESSSSMTVDVWHGKKLVSEQMGLLIGVGQGAANGPALVHLKYRPKGSKRGQRPLAFVGKGVTFDTGGLDIKINSGMRLMKKDMGGSASLCGLAYWLEQSQLAVPCDFYLALAENAVDKHSYRPGDILTARSGTTVEIDNTDAEGRLVLADAIDVAVKTKGADAPEALIDLATLTGAMRVALGTRVAGLFANDDSLAETLLAAAQRTSEPSWRMPLYSDYLSSLRSSVADMANSGPSRFGGAIVAALFLQRFVGDIPWAHFDMYAWSDGNTGGCIEAGGTGQCVQLLADFLRARTLK